MAPDRESELRATSDEMVSILDELRSIEHEKRSEPIGSDRFVELVEQATSLSRSVFRWSALQQDIAHRVTTEDGSGRSIRQVTPRPLDRLLAAWREAEFRMHGSPAGTPARDDAVSDMEQLREEYRELHERLVSGATDGESLPWD